MPLPENIIILFYWTAPCEAFFAFLKSTRKFYSIAAVHIGGFELE